MIGSACLLLLPTSLAALAANLPVLVICRALQGLLIPGTTVVGIAYIQDEFSPAWRSLGMGAYVSASVLGCSRPHPGRVNCWLAGLALDIHLFCPHNRAGDSGDGPLYSVAACSQLKPFPLHLSVITPVLPGVALPHSTCCGTTPEDFLVRSSAGLPGRVSVGGACSLSASSRWVSALPLS
jgi:MFS family permease